MRYFFDLRGNTVKIDFSGIELGNDAATYQEGALRAQASPQSFELVDYNGFTHIAGRDETGRIVCRFPIAHLRVRLYRVYLMNGRTFTSQPPAEIEADSDDVAIQKAQTLIKNQDAEIWQSSRRVAVIQRQELYRKEIELTKQEEQMIRMIRGSIEAKEDFQLSVSFEDSRVAIIVSKLPHGARNKAHGEGDTFEEAWRNMSPLWK